MYHDIGLRFTSIEDVKLKIRALQKHWDNSIAPAIVKYAVENGRYRPESDATNGKMLFLLVQWTIIFPPFLLVVAMYCLTLLVDKLKPKSGPSAVKRLNSLICFAPVS